MTHSGTCTLPCGALWRTDVLVDVAGLACTDRTHLYKTADYYHIDSAAAARELNLQSNTRCMSTMSLGSHIAARLVEVGIAEYFCVPGDFNMTLLDQLNANKNLRMINCCNELEAGYAADGYARAKGMCNWPLGSVTLVLTSGLLLQALGVWL